MSLLRRFLSPSSKKVTAQGNEILLDLQNITEKLVKYELTLNSELSKHSDAIIRRQKEIDSTRLRFIDHLVLLYKFSLLDNGDASKSYIRKGNLMLKRLYLLQARDYLVIDVIQKRLEMTRVWSTKCHEIYNDVSNASAKSYSDNTYTLESKLPLDVISFTQNINDVLSEHPVIRKLNSRIEKLDSKLSDAEVRVRAFLESNSLKPISRPIRREIIHKSCIFQRDSEIAIATYSNEIAEHIQTIVSLFSSLLHVSLHPSVKWIHVYLYAQMKIIWKLKKRKQTSNFGSDDMSESVLSLLSAMTDPDPCASLLILLKTGIHIPPEIAPFVLSSNEHLFQSPSTSSERPKSFTRPISNTSASRTSTRSLFSSTSLTQIPMEIIAHLRGVQEFLESLSFSEHERENRAIMFNHVICDQRTKEGRLLQRFCEKVFQVLETHMYAYKLTENLEFDPTSKYFQQLVQQYSIPILDVEQFASSAVLTSAVPNGGLKKKKSIGANEPVQEQIVEPPRILLADEFIDNFDVYTSIGAAANESAGKNAQHDLQIASNTSSLPPIAPLSQPTSVTSAPVSTTSTASSKRADGALTSLPLQRVLRSFVAHFTKELMQHYELFGIEEPHAATEVSSSLASEFESTSSAALSDSADAVDQGTTGTSTATSTAPEQRNTRDAFSPPKAMTIATKKTFSDRVKSLRVISSMRRGIEKASSVSSAGTEAQKAAQARADAELARLARTLLENLLFSRIRDALYEGVEVISVSSSSSVAGGSVGTASSTAVVVSGDAAPEGKGVEEFATRPPVPSENDPSSIYSFSQFAAPSIVHLPSKVVDLLASHDDSAFQHVSDSILSISTSASSSSSPGTPVHSSASFANNASAGKKGFRVANPRRGSLDAISDSIRSLFSSTHPKSDPVASVTSSTSTPHTLSSSFVPLLDLVSLLKRDKTKAVSAAASGDMDSAVRALEASLLSEHAFEASEDATGRNILAPPLPPAASSASAAAPPLSKQVSDAKADLPNQQGFSSKPEGLTACGLWKPQGSFPSLIEKRDMIWQKKRPMVAKANLDAKELQLSFLNPLETDSVWLSLPDDLLRPSSSEGVFGISESPQQGMSVFKYTYSPYSMASQLLGYLDILDSPSDMLMLMNAAVESAISEATRRASSGSGSGSGNSNHPSSSTHQASMSADDLIPLLSYVVCRSNWRRPHACLVFLSSYGVPVGSGGGREAYLITLLQSCVSWVCSRTNASLNAAVAVAVSGNPPSVATAPSPISTAGPSKRSLVSSPSITGPKRGHVTASPSIQKKSFSSASSAGSSDLPRSVRYSSVESATSGGQFEDAIDEALTYQPGWTTTTVASESTAVVAVAAEAIWNEHDAVAAAPVKEDESDEEAEEILMSRDQPTSEPLNSSFDSLLDASTADDSALYTELLQAEMELNINEEAEEIEALRNLIADQDKRETSTFANMRSFSFKK
jgi:Vacuolar sorting protein 9 (VPS9) domain